MRFPLLGQRHNATAGNTRHPKKKLSPQAMVALAFAAIMGIGAVILCLPISSSTHRWTPLMDALFTSVSATSLTGLITLDTQTHWSAFGHVVIMLLIQLGGLGFMTVTTLMAIIVGRRMGLRIRSEAMAEGRGQEFGDVRASVAATILFTLIIETIVAVILGVRFATTYELPLGHAIFYGIFHAVSAFNNAGFALYTDNVILFNSDAWILLPLSFALIVGGIGFPVLLEGWRVLTWPKAKFPRPHWSITFHFTLLGTAFLIVAGTAMIIICEWNGVLAPLSFGDKILNAFFAGVSPRTAGFNALDYAEFRPATLWGTDILMVIGGGSGGTAGGVKITTVMVIIAVFISYVTNGSDAVIHGRRISSTYIRKALTIVAFAMASIGASVSIILLLSPEFTLDQVLFEVCSAFGTVGLSTGITARLTCIGQIILMVLMYAGRIGPVLLATALFSRSTPRAYTYPVERPVIG